MGASMVPGVLAKAAVHQGPVGAAEAAIAQLASEAAMRRLGLGDHEQSTGIAIETVHDAGALGAAEQ